MKYSRKRLVLEWVKEFADVARRQYRRPALIVTHRNADPDAVGSALLVSELLKAYGVRSCIIVPEGLSSQSRSILRILSLELPHCESSVLGTAELVVVVDSANYSQLGDLANLATKRQRLVIDHHSPGTLYEGSIVIADSRAGSTTEIVSVIARELGVCLDSKVASAAYAGVYYDTRRFSSPGLYSLEAAQYLFECGARLPQNGRKRDTGDFSERYARVVGASRARVARACGELIVAVTHIGSFESRVANALVDLGADVAVAVKIEEGGYRAAVRVSERAISIGVRADYIARYLAEKLGGQGGGHERAGLAHLPLIAGSPEDVADRIAKSLPGKVARICVEARRDARRQADSIR